MIAKIISMMMVIIKIVYNVLTNVKTVLLIIQTVIIAKAYKENKMHHNVLVNLDIMMMVYNKIVKFVAINV